MYHIGAGTSSYWTGMDGMLPQMDNSVTELLELHEEYLNNIMDEVVRSLEQIAAKTYPSSGE